MKPFVAATLIAALVPAVPAAPAGPSTPSGPHAPARYGTGVHGVAQAAHREDGAHSHGSRPNEGHAHGEQACPPGTARLRPGADGRHGPGHRHDRHDRGDLPPGAVDSIEKEIRNILSGLGFMRPSMSTQEIPSPPGGKPKRWPRVTVPVHFHVIHDGPTGNISRERIERQIAGLNKAHSGEGPGADTDFRFRLVDVTRTDNGAWYRDPERHERIFKPQLRKGGAGTLNLYSADMGRDMLGWSTFPWRYRSEPKMDGVVIHPESMPGGSIKYFNLGHTATHEIGHWLGLYHTFQDGCTNTNDRVRDTPAEREPTNACPASKDTCPTRGRDPIHNFMDYGYDTCMNQFSRGQGNRMHQAWAAYRGRSSEG